MKPQRILVLGSGFVADSIADYFAKFSSIKVTFATIDRISGEKICSRCPERFSLEILNAVSEKEKLDKLVKSHSLVMSLIPPPLHPHVAESCLRMNTDLVTSSYLSPRKSY